MDFCAFQEGVSEESDLSIDEIRREAWQATFVVSARFWKNRDLGLDDRHVFEVVAEDVREINGYLGWVGGSIDWTEDHPLLWNHNSEWSDLYFSTTPHSPDAVLGRLYRAHEYALRQWRPFSDNLVASIETLERGRGLLARGPERLMQLYEEWLAGLLVTNRIRNREYHASPSARVLLIGEAFAVCNQVTVNAITVS